MKFQLFEKRHTKKALANTKYCVFKNMIPVFRI